VITAEQEYDSHFQISEIPILGC